MYKYGFFGALAGMGLAALGCSDEPAGTTTTGTTAGNTTSGNSSGGGGSSTTATGGGGTSTTSTGGGGSSSSNTGGADPGPYPEGPYGNQMGDTMPPLVWQGHHNPAADQVASNTPFINEFNTQQIRVSSAPYALIHTAAVF